MSTKIRMLLAARSMTLEVLGKKMEPPTSKQNLSRKLARDNFTDKDLQAIAKACDATFEGVFTLNDTKKTI